MKSYIKLYGPSVSKAITALEQVALKMPQCSIWHHLMPPQLPFAEPDSPLFNTFIGDSGLSPLRGQTAEIPKERIHKMISSSGNTLGDSDFFFEWHTEPTWDQVRTLIGKIDEALKDTGSMYTIYTR